MSINHTTLEGQVLAMEPLRFTPIGLPVLRITLSHESVQNECGHPRTVMAEIAVVAMGDCAKALMAMLAGSAVSSAPTLRVSGFLAKARKTSRALSLHAQSIDTV